MEDFKTQALKKNLFMSQFKSLNESNSQFKRFSLNDSKSKQMFISDFVKYSIYLLVNNKALQRPQSHSQELHILTTKSLKYE